jgi:hypothetical protein
VTSSRSGAGRDRRLIAYVQALPSKGGTRALPAFESLLRMHTGFNGDEAGHSLHEGQ